MHLVSEEVVLTRFERRRIVRTASGVDRQPRNVFRAVDIRFNDFEFDPVRNSTISPRSLVDRLIAHDEFSVDVQPDRRVPPVDGSDGRMSTIHHVIGDLYRVNTGLCPEHGVFVFNLERASVTNRGRTLGYPSFFTTPMVPNCRP